MQGMSSYGMNFQLGESDGSYVDLGDVISGEPPKKEQQFADDKYLGQPTRGIRSIPTFANLGTGTIVVKTNGEGYAQLMQWQDDEPPRRLYAKITFPKEVNDSGVAQTTAAVAKFRCYLQDVGTPFPADGGRLETTITVKADGWDDDTDMYFLEGS